MLVVLGSLLLFVWLPWFIFVLRKTLREAEREHKCWWKKDEKEQKEK
jgi:hypothetical protein